MPTQVQSPAAQAFQALLTPRVRDAVKKIGVRTVGAALLGVVMLVRTHRREMRRVQLTNACLWAGTIPPGNTVYRDLVRNYGRSGFMPWGMGPMISPF